MDSTVGGGVSTLATGTGTSLSRSFHIPLRSRPSISGAGEVESSRGSSTTRSVLAAVSPSQESHEISLRIPTAFHEHLLVGFADMTPLKQQTPDNQSQVTQSAVLDTKVEPASKVRKYLPETTTALRSRKIPRYKSMDVRCRPLWRIGCFRVAKRRASQATVRSKTLPRRFARYTRTQSLSKPGTMPASRKVAFWYYQHTRRGSQAIQRSSVLWIHAPCDGIYAFMAAFFIKVLLCTLIYWWSSTRPLVTHTLMLSIPCI